MIQTEISGYHVEMLITFKFEIPLLLDYNFLTINIDICKPLWQKTVVLDLFW